MCFKGIAAAFGRLGGIVTSFVSEGMQIRAAVCLYGSLSLFCMVLSHSLITETKGMDLANQIDRTGWCFQESVLFFFWI